MKNIDLEIQKIKQYRISELKDSFRVKGFANMNRIIDEDKERYLDYNHSCQILRIHLRFDKFGNIIGDTREN